MRRVIALDQIDDPDLLRKHAQLFQEYAEYLRTELKELREELAQLKGLGQLELAVVRQHEQLAKLRHKIFGESSEATARSPHPDTTRSPGSGAGSAAARNRNASLEDKIVRL